MIHLDKKGIENLEKMYRANLINSVSGYKPANLIATRNEKGINNIAIFSSVIHLGANPALLGFVQRPITEFSHTYKNIMATGYYSINHVHQHFVHQAHYSSARFAADISEFETCDLTPIFLDDFLAPYLFESEIKIGLRFIEAIPIKHNDTTLIIGEIEHLYFKEYLLQEDGNIALDIAKDVAVAGLESYYKVEKLAQFPYAKTNQKPDFQIF